jgi:hypothetical protein
MHKLNFILIATVGCSFLTSLSHGQDATVLLPAPATKLESLETNVGIVIIKASTEIGVLSVNTGVVSVKCREVTDETGRKERGIAVEIGQKGQLKDRMLIDNDELNPLLNGLGYLNKLETSVTSLNAFDAVYTTKGGFRIAALGNRRTGSIQFAVRDARLSLSPVLLSRQEMTQFCVYMDQAKKQLDLLGQKQ